MAVTHDPSSPTAEQNTIRCAMCGCEFDPVGQSACRGCPLHGDCSLVCCPNCGFETVDVRRSRLAGVFASLFARQDAKKGGR